MPTVPQSDPGELEALTQGQVQPEPAHMMMALADMHARGRLIDPNQQSNVHTLAIRAARRGRQLRK